MSASDHTAGPNRTRRKWLVVVGLLVASLLVVLLGGQPFITRKIEVRIAEKLRERSLSATWSHLSWTPWQGVYLKDIAVRRLDGRQVADLENLAVRLPWNAERVSRWTVRDARLVLHDEVGKVTIEDVSIRFDARPGEVTVLRATGREDGVEAQLSGKIATKKTPARKPFLLNLAAVRGTLAALDVRRDTGPFRITGDFHIDLRGPAPLWSAKLKGAGEKLEWKSIPLRNATGEAALSSADTTIRISMTGSSGSAKGTLTRTGWGEPPFVFEGELADAAGRVDSFNGRYGKKSLLIERLEGPANLWEIAAGIPIIHGKLPESVAVRQFPSIKIEDLRGDFSSDTPRWEMASLATQGPGGIVATLKRQEVEITGLQGGAGYDGKTWELDDVSGETLGGKVTVAGNFTEASLTAARVKAEGIELAEVKRVAGAKTRKKKNPGILYGSYRGSVNFKTKELDGGGNARMENAPVIEVPLLDPVHQLFASVVPGIQHPEEGRFDVKFTAKSQLVHISRFEAKGGSLTVSAEGTANLKTRKVAGSARGKLTGLPGVLTSPLSRLLEMEVTGTLDDIDVKPLGPAKLASNAASGTVGTAVDTLEEAGNISRDVIKEAVIEPLRELRREVSGKDR